MGQEHCPSCWTPLSVCVWQAQSQELLWLMVVLEQCGRGD